MEVIFDGVARHSGRTCPAATSETSRIRETLEIEVAYLVDERVGDSMPHHSQLASFVVGAFCIGHLYAQGLWPWEGSSTHSTRFVDSKRGDFPGGASGFCPVALASELRRNVR